MTPEERAERNGRRREARTLERERGQIAVAVEQVVRALEAVPEARRARVVRAVVVLLDIDVGVSGETCGGG